MKTFNFPQMKNASECIKLLNDHQRNTMVAILFFKMRPKLDKRFLYTKQSVLQLAILHETRNRPPC